MTVDLGTYSARDMMIITAARSLSNGMVCFVGIGLPSTAANLARATHAPDLVMIYESGCIGAKPTQLPLSIGDGEVAETADTVVSVPEIFTYWLQAGRIDVGFLGGAQVDRWGNINSTVIGDYEKPAVRLPGAGGAPEIAGASKEVIVMINQSTRTFVDSLPFRTTVGYGEGAGDRKRYGLTGGGPTQIITDLGVLRPDPETFELTMTQLHPGVSLDQVRGATGWPLLVADEIKSSAPPTVDEITLLRRLESRLPINA